MGWVTDDASLAVHAIGGASHSASTIAEFNAKLSDGSVDVAGTPRPPTAHAIGGAAHTGSTLAELNALVADATLDDAGDLRNPTQHALAGAAHSSSTLAQLNALVSDATLDDAGDSRVPSGPASGDLSGSYPNPDVSAITSGGTQLTIGAVADGQILARSGTDIVGVAATTPAAHASTHLPNGSDPLTTASGISTGDANTEGTANSFARSDHGHEVTAIVEGGGQDLSVDDIDDADILVRTGNTITGLSPGPAGSMLVSNGSTWSSISAPATVGSILVSTASGAQWVKPAFSEVRGSTNNPTKNGATYSVIPEMTTSVTPTGGRIFVFMKINMNMQDEDDGTIRIVVDGTPDDETDAGYEATDGLLGLLPGSLDGTNFICMGVVEGLTPGVPVTVQGQWSETSGTMRAREDNRVLIVWEQY